MRVATRSAAPTPVAATTSPGPISRQRGTDVCPARVCCDMTCTLRTGSPGELDRETGWPTSVGTGECGPMGHVDVAGVTYELPDGRMLLDEVSFRVGDGAKVALVGANGAGKTTLLR